MRKIVIVMSTLCVMLLSVVTVQAQEWTPEQQVELFGYCEKPALIKQLKISEAIADRIGQIHHWARLTKIKIEANASDTFATAGEVEEEVVKKYKSLSLSGDQVKALVERRKKSLSEPCEVITLVVNRNYDTIAKPQLQLQFRNKFRRTLMDKLEVNGKQADMLIEAEVWKQKEALEIAKIPETDFERIRKTVGLYKELERKYGFIGITEQQKEGAKAIFKQAE
ncbi:MAG: hypothetical protein HYI21_00430 [Sediminibacterium sp. Gen4]|jgi:hypothetical protein|uniref:hypothetical protein n=1 Tax=unclassified Sediminibacterium TaxID=2635961 RepID=UPI0015BFC12C|nr:MULTISPECIES: hypothetical protein [unclassified Sediminibacterium]MBW0161812.1 hypothetical protein [Sediminibacterium sp.]MBW0165017.1 hypothetical protein [Sediminibacterium sp.]NWK64472.1 hypothetical protein [Sediminibacterium sp. Gen4]